MKMNAPKRKIFDAVDMMTGDSLVRGEKTIPGVNVQMLPIDQIKAFRDHPFRLYEEERLRDMVESVKEHGILNPVIVRRTGNGYEMLSFRPQSTECCETG